MIPENSWKYVKQGRKRTEMIFGGRLRPILHKWAEDDDNDSDMFNHEDNIMSKHYDFL